MGVHLWVRFVRFLSALTSRKSSQAEFLQAVLFAGALGCSLVFPDKTGLFLVVPTSLVIRKLNFGSVAAKFTGPNRSVVAPALVVGRSGMEHEFALGAGPTSPRMPRDVVVEAVVGGGPADETKIISFYVKVFDVGAKSAIFAVCPGLTPKAAELAKEYGLIVVESREPDQLVERLTEALVPFMQKGEAGA